MKIVEDLKRTKVETLKYYEINSKFYNNTYGNGKWTIRQIIVHLADAESVLHERIKRGICEPKSIVFAFDQDKWVTQLEYNLFPLEIAKNIYISNRDSIIYLAEKYYEKYGNNQFIHSETGLRTVKDEFDKVVWHNESHLEQLKTAINTL